MVHMCEFQGFQVTLDLCAAGGYGFVLSRLRSHNRVGRRYVLRKSTSGYDLPKNARLCGGEVVISKDVDNVLQVIHMIQFYHSLRREGHFQLARVG